MTKHTPGPWKINERNHIAGMCQILGSDNTIVANATYHKVRETQEANAEFIVRACNSHEELLEACKEAFCWITNKKHCQKVETQLDIEDMLIKAIHKAEAPNA